MATNLDLHTSHDFIVGDFEAAPNAVAAIPGAAHRGNFMFGRQAMTLLEWAARLCKSDGFGGALAAFASAFEKIDTRYFTPLPGHGDAKIAPSRVGERPRNLGRYGGLRCSSWSVVRSDVLKINTSLECAPFFPRW